MSDDPYQDDCKDSGRESPALMERCDIRFPELLKLFPPG